MVCAHVVQALLAIGYRVEAPPLTIMQYLAAGNCARVRARLLFSIFARASHCASHCDFEDRGILAGVGKSFLYETKRATP